ARSHAARDNGSAFTARSTRSRSARSASRTGAAATATPESQAFNESWFRYVKERCVWRNEFETLDQAREVIAAYIDHYTIGPTAGSTTARPVRCGPPGTMRRKRYRKPRPRLDCLRVVPTPSGAADWFLTSGGAPWGAV